ncbi:hypothetical protein CP98_00013 [Sphingobium yanoikuyae]|uniref:Methyltransferase type 11 domain-containing protein n=1 Tax=Sphingobium yanoikuyae TaxID=13690 RepID=A0A084ETP4_SPHYA|nr:methyltransferase domain-containing protein [Sphingobium yanoikuyae]KEZ21336.1 hypothetical protein CP98_00013 [Sphingobium yanoikuyae]
MKANIPLAFDAAFYTRKYPDLSELSPESAEDHFLRYGIVEGRQGHPRGARPAFTDYINTFDNVLEIGPFCSPVARGENVKYLDVFNEAQLRDRAEELGMDASRCPAKIDYVGDISNVRETFDAVVSSHSIEHQPDLIHHLKGVEGVLNHGGVYLIFIPDKRYCFDHYIQESAVGEVVQAHHERRTSHILRSVIEHHALNTHNDPRRHWAGDHEVEHGKPLADRIQDAIGIYKNSEGYVDVHAWYFTPNSFVNVMSNLMEGGFTELSVVECHASLRDELEFFAIMKKI